MSAPIEAVRGMRDVLPSDADKLSFIQHTLENVLARHGYAALDAPDRKSVV